MAYAKVWSAGLLAVVAGFLTFSLGPYLSLEPARSRVPATFGLHYPLLVAHVALASLWLWCTFAGYLAGRRHRVAQHRRHMLRGATLALSVISNRIWSPLLYLALQPLRDSVFGGSEQKFVWLVAGLAGWLGWVVPLAGVQCWLAREPDAAATSISEPPDALRV